MLVKKVMRGASQVYILSGSFTHTTFQRFNSVLKDIKTAPSNIEAILIDLSSLDSLDSMALGMMILAKQEADKKGLSFSVTEPKPNLKKYIQSDDFRQAIGG